MPVGRIGFPLKPSGGWAEPVSMMESGMKSAWLRAGLKLGVGLALVLALIGIRMITANRDGVESGIAALERLDSELAAESLPATAAPVTEGPRGADAGGGSIVARLSAGVLGSDSGARGGDELVSCRLGATTQFMRSDDCAIRGGAATVFETSR